MALAFKLHPHLPDTAGIPVAGVVADKLTLTFRRWKNAIDLTYTVEVSEDLNTWSEVTGVVGIPVDHGDGTETVTITDTETLVDGQRRFLRVEVAKEG